MSSLAEKAEILAGELVESVYDSIEMIDARYRYTSVFGKSELFSALGLSDMSRHFKISRYLYCTVKGLSFFPIGNNWMGYMAYSDGAGGRRIVVVFRGTLSRGEWWKDINASMVPFGFVPSTQVHNGFLSLYKSNDPTAAFSRSIRDQLLSELEVLASVSTLVDITVVGHSLGGALTTLAACDIGVNFAKSRSIHVSAFTFGSPKVGNADFKKVIEEHAILQRYENVGDLVPTLPPHIPVIFPYVAVGTLHTIDWSMSPYLKSLTFFDVRKKHDLELYMHGIALQEGEYSEEDAFAEMGLSPTTSMEDLSNELVQNDPHAMDELQSIKDLFRVVAWDDSDSLHKFLLQCVYVARRQVSGQKQDPSAQDRDFVLVNKWQDSLKDNLDVPEQWWVHRNKDVKQDESTGLWLPRTKRPADQPVPSNPEYN